jgi:hypothetical protein
MIELTGVPCFDFSTIGACVCPVYHPFSAFGRDRPGYWKEFCDGVLSTPRLLCNFAEPRMPGLGGPAVVLPPA